MDTYAMLVELELYAQAAAGVKNPNSDLRNSDLSNLPALFGFR